MTEIITNDKLHCSTLLQSYTLYRKHTSTNKVYCSL